MVSPTSGGLHSRIFLECMSTSVLWGVRSANMSEAMRQSWQRDEPDGERTRSIRILRSR